MDNVSKSPSELFESFRVRFYPHCLRFVTKNSLIFIPLFVTPQMLNKFMFKLYEISQLYAKRALSESTVIETRRYLSFFQKQKKSIKEKLKNATIKITFIFIPHLVKKIHYTM